MKITGKTRKRMLKKFKRQMRGLDNQGTKFFPAAKFFESGLVSTSPADLNGNPI